MAATTAVREILEFLAESEGLAPLILPFDEAIDWAGASGREVDNALLEAQAEGLLTGDRRQGDGSNSRWFSTRLTVAGLRELGQWPPAGREWEDGPWDEGYWGTRARPLLQRLHEQPPLDGFYLKPTEEDEEGWRDWSALLLLGQTELIAGSLQSGGIDTLRVLPAGREALNPAPRDVIDDARAKLRTGARVDAIVTAIERGLGARLRELAAKHGVEASGAEGQHVALGRLNNALHTAGVYDESDHAQISAWLKLRNRFAHGEDDAISDERATSALDGVRVFLDEHSA
jgi:hypothetical protein